jgi:hypothetical protein
LCSVEGNSSQQPCPHPLREILFSHLQTDPKKTQIRKKKKVKREGK